MINHRHVATSLVAKMTKFFADEGYRPKIEVTNLDPDAGPRGSMVSVTFASNVTFEWVDIICYRSPQDPPHVHRVVATFMFGSKTYEVLVARKPYYMPIRRVNWNEVKGAEPNPTEYRFTTNPE